MCGLYFGMFIGHTSTLVPILLSNGGTIFNSHTFQALRDLCIPDKKGGKLGKQLYILALSHLHSSQPEKMLESRTHRPPSRGMEDASNIPSKEEATPPCPPPPPERENYPN